MAPPPGAQCTGRPGRSGVAPTIALDRVSSQRIVDCGLGWPVRVGRRNPYPAFLEGTTAEPELRGRIEKLQLFVFHGKVIAGLGFDASGHCRREAGDDLLVGEGAA